MYDFLKDIPTSTFPIRKAVTSKPFKLAVVGLCSFNVFSILKGLCDSGAQIAYVWDQDQTFLEAFIKSNPNSSQMDPDSIIKSDADMIVNCLLPSQRAAYSIRAIENNKAVFSDTPGFLKEEDADNLRQVILQKNGRYTIYFRDHFHSESFAYANNLISEGKIGKVLLFSDTVSYYLDENLYNSNFNYFFHPFQAGDIFINTICSQIELFLLMTDNLDAKIQYASRRNLAHPHFPLFYDYGELIIRGDNGIIGDLKADWLAPKQTKPSFQSTITGKKGKIELEKLPTPGNSHIAENIYITNDEKTQVIDAHNTIGFNFFTKLILDCYDKNSRCSIMINGLSLPLFCIKATEISIKACNCAQNTPINL